MSAEHNHPPHCCCPVLLGAPTPRGLECMTPEPHAPHSWIGSGPSPAYLMCGGVPIPADERVCHACPEHGDLATPYTKQETTK
jgi:hypothetical protein